MTSEPVQPLLLSRPRESASRVWWIAGLIAVAILSAYAGTAGVPLLLDDFYTVSENPSIRSLRSPDRIVAPPVHAPTAGRPLANFSFALSYALSGTTPWGYHVINVAVHGLAALVLFGLVRRTLRTPRLAARFGAGADGLAGLIAVLWALHPVQPQTVTYISQRTEALMGLCYLLTLYCFVRGATGRATRWHALAVAACFLGAMCKEVIVTAPVIALLYDRAFLAATWGAALRRRRWFYAGLTASWLLLAWLMFDVKNRGVGFGAGVSAFHYALTQGRAVLLYLKLAAWPEPLVFDYGPLLVETGTAALPALLVLGGLLAVALAAWRRHALWAFLPAWFFLLLAPTSSFVPVAGAPIAENRLYLPLAAVVSAGVLGAYGALGSRLTRLAALAVAGAALVATLRRNADFQSGVRLWSDTVAKAPGNHRAHEHLADFLALQPGRRAEAQAHYETALRINPASAPAHNHLALLFAADPARSAEALAHYREGLRIQPNLATAHYNLAVLLDTLPERRHEALSHYDEALRLNPNLWAAHINRANLLVTMPDRHAEASAHYEAALRLAPDSPQAHNNYAALLAGQVDRHMEAIIHYETAVRLNPDYLVARNNLANLLADIPERRAEALAHFRTAVRQAPGHAGLHYNLARHLELIGAHHDEALAEYRRALQLDASLTAAQEGLTRLQAKP